MAWMWMLAALAAIGPVVGAVKMDASCGGSTNTLPIWTGTPSHVRSAEHGDLYTVGEAHADSSSPSAPSSNRMHKFRPVYSLLTRALRRNPTLPLTHALTIAQRRRLVFVLTRAFYTRDGRRHGRPWDGESPPRVRDPVRVGLCAGDAA